MLHTNAYKHMMKFGMIKISVSPFLYGRYSEDDLNTSHSKVQFLELMLFASTRGQSLTMNATMLT